jgi:hypothetical protein
MNLRETGWEAVELIHLAQDRDWWQVLVNMVINLQVLEPHNYIIQHIKSLYWLDANFH